MSDGSQKQTPEEVVQRTQAYVAATKRISLQTNLGIFFGGTIALMLFVAAIIFGWPMWTRVAAIAVVFTIGEASGAVASRRRQAELEKFAFRCPHCRAPLATKGLWGSKALKEMRTVAEGNCPSCFAVLATRTAS